MRLGRIAPWSALVAVLLFSRLQLAGGESSAIVATVGSAQLRAADVERRLQAMPVYQRRALGSTPAEMREKVVREQLVVDLLLDQEAARRQLEQDPAVRAQINEALRRSVEEQERQRLQREEPVTDEDVRRYYEANRARFATPRRLRLWRILVDDDKLARRIIADARRGDGPARWSQDAREHSLDTATRMRKGDLGFVRSDGRTDVPRVRVDPALFVAADAVRDGDLVPQPVREGKRFAAVWRRGSLPEIARTLEQEASAIRQVLMRARVREAVDALVTELRRHQVSAVDESLLDHVSVPPPSFHPASGPSDAVGPGPVDSVTPQAGQRGLR